MEAVMDPYSKQVANYLASMLKKGKFRQDCGNNSQQEINNIYAQWHLGWTQHILSIAARRFSQLFSSACPRESAENATSGYDTKRTEKAKPLLLRPVSTGHACACSTKTFAKGTLTIADCALQYSTCISILYKNPKHTFMVM